MGTYSYFYRLEPGSELTVSRFNIQDDYRKGVVKTLLNDGSLEERAEGNSLLEAKGKKEYEDLKDFIEKLKEGEFPSASYFSFGGIVIDGEFYYFIEDLGPYLFRVEEMGEYNLLDRLHYIIESPGEAETKEVFPIERRDLGYSFREENPEIYDDIETPIGKEDLLEYLLSRYDAREIC